MHRSFFWLTAWGIRKTKNFLSENIWRWNTFATKSFLFYLCLFCLVAGSTASQLPNKVSRLIIPARGKNDNKGRISSFLVNDKCNLPSCYSQTVKLFLEVSRHSEEKWSFKSDGYVLKIWNSWHQKKRLSTVSSEWDLDLKLKPLWYELSKCLKVTEVSSQKIIWLS